METAERRREILKLLCRRRYEKMENLAEELGVSKRTVQRDIDTLSRSYPIYTKSGRYEGGVYLLETYTMERLYMSDAELEVLKKIADYLKNKADVLNYEEKQIFKSIISDYSKPIFKKG